MKRKTQIGIVAAVVLLLVAGMTGCPGFFGPADTTGGQAAPGGQEPPDDQVTVDMTGWWGFTFVPEGEDPFGPIGLYVYQSGAALSTPWGLTGTTDGSDMTLGGRMHDDYGGAEFSLSGTIEDGVIAGLITGDMGGGTFTLARPTPPFGSLAVSGTFGGEPVELETVHVVLGSADSSAEYGFSFGTAIGMVNVHRGPVKPSVGTFAVTADPGEPDTVQVLFFPQGDEDGYEAIDGEIVIGSYSDEGAEGTFDLAFPDGEWLSGSFNVIFDSDDGETSIEGFFAGVEIELEQLTHAWSDEYMDDAMSGLYVEAGSGELEVRLGLHWVGPMEPGVIVIHDFWWGGVDFRPFGGPYDHFPLNEALTGTLTLTIDRLDEAGIAGSWVEEGGDLTIEFDVYFPGFVHM